jgi:acetyl esterase/lipase
MPDGRDWAARDWASLAQAERDAAYNNMAAVPDSGARLQRWAERSAKLRASPCCEPDIAYGDSLRNRIDLFRCGVASAPLLVFIHGGWWRRNSKEVFACMAEGPLALGLDVATIGYTLAPEAGLSRIAAEIDAALDRIARAQAARGGPDGCVLSGWSAGGHLTALALRHPFVRAGLAISGVFDLAPIADTDINTALRLTPSEIAELSPIRLPRPDKPLIVAYGEAELPEMQRQSTDFIASGRAEPMPLPGKDHFSILDALQEPDGALARACVRLAAA